MSKFINFKRIISLITFIVFLSGTFPTDGILSSPQIPQTTFALESNTNYIQPKYKKQLEMTYNKTRVIKEDGSLWSWGSDMIPGDGTYGYKYYPVKITNDVNYVEFNSSINFAIKKDGSLWGWGKNNCCMLNHELSSNNTYYSPIKVMDGVRYFQSTDCSIMVIKNDGSLWAWGNNFYGRLGDGTNTPYVLTPTKIMDGVSYLENQGSNTMAIKNDGSLWGWGENYVGQLGDGTDVYKNTPVKIMDDVSSVKFSGSEMVYAIKNDGSLWWWGARQKFPVNIMDGVSVEDTGIYNTVIKNDRSLWCIKNDPYKAQSDGSPIMVPVKLLDDVVYYDTDYESGMAIKSDGSLWGWGKNYHGQLGDGTTIDKDTPVKVMDGVNHVSIYNETCMAVQNDGSLWVWGFNWYYQLGDGTDVDKKTPIKLMDGVCYVDMEQKVSAAIKNDGSLWMWGLNEYGQIGNGTNTPAKTPQYIMNMKESSINSGFSDQSIEINEQIDIDNRMQNSSESYHSDPVDTASGAHVFSKSYLSQNGAINFGFNMNYNSLLLKPGVMGKAWKHNYEGSIAQIDSNKLEINWGANNKSRYIRDEGSSEYISANPFTPYDTVSISTEGDYVLSKQDGSKYKFNATGKLSEIINRNSQKLVLSYGADNKMSTVSEPVSNKQLHFAYDASGRLASVSDNLSRNIMFEYDQNNNLTGITEPNGYKTSYTYNELGQVLTSTDSEGRTLFTNTYDSNGRVITQLDSLNSTTHFSYDETSQPGKIITTATDRNGNSTALTHDAKYNLLSVRDELGKVSNYEYDSRGNRIRITDAKGGITQMGYDQRGNTTSIVNSINQTTNFFYDTNDNLLKIVNADSKEKTFTYDDKNNLITAADSLGNTTTYAYNANGQLVSQTMPEGGTTNYTYTNGTLTKITDPTGVYSTFTYDAAGRVTAITDAAGKSIQYEYDSVDHVTKAIDRLGNFVEYTFDDYGNKLTDRDARGNITSYIYTTDGMLNTVKDAKGNQTKYQYDPERRLTKVIDAKGNATTYTYDAKGRMTQVTDALGNAVHYSYDELDRLISVTDALGNIVSTNTYDAIGNVLSTKDALNRTVTHQYDNLNRITELTDPMSHTTKMFYDSEGRLVSVTDAKNKTANQVFNRNGQITAITDLNGNTTSFGYDAAGRLLSQTKSSGKPVVGTYNSLGQLQTSTNGRGQTAAYAYDDNGRIVSMTDPAGQITYTYDAAGNAVTVQDEKGTISFVYDQLNRVTQYTDVNGNVIKYGYGANGNLEKLIYPDNKEVNYTYDELNRMTKVTDWNGRITTYEYDANSRLVTANNSDGSIVTYTYDQMSQKLTQTDKDKNGKSIIGFTFAYNANGNVISEKCSISKKAGSLKPIEMTYGQGNQAQSYNGTDIVMDDDGNMVTGVVNGKTETLTYDARNRLTHAGNLTYEYDALNNRTSVTDSVYSPSHVSYVVNPVALLSQVLMEKDSQGNAIAHYVYGLNGLIGMQDDVSGEYYTYHYDMRGSTVALTNREGIVTDRYEYGAFGELANRIGETRNCFLYNGRDGVVTDSNGLYYMRARYYSPDMKRFVNEDTVLGGIMNAQSLNRFAYVNGNPVMGIDPLGRMTWAATATGFGEWLAGGLSSVGSAIGTGLTTIAESAVIGSAAAIAVLSVPATAITMALNPVIAGNPERDWEIRSTPGSKEGSKSQSGIATMSGGDGSKGGSKTHGHHSFPKYLGGHPKQKLSDIIDWSHRELHSDLRNFEGGWLNPKKGNTGAQIIEKNGQDKVIDGLRRFYSQDKYKDLLNDFEDAVKFTKGD